jgi:hypothetical protein
MCGDWKEVITKEIVTGLQEIGTVRKTYEEIFTAVNMPIWIVT